MLTKREVIYQGLASICDELCNTKLIMFNAPLSKLLKYIASHKELTDYVKDCNELIDYEKEYFFATSSMSNVNLFKLPHDNAKIIALVTGILYDVDRNNIDLVNFIQQFFSFGDMNKSFSEFLQQILVPYKKAFKDFVVYTQVKIIVEDTLQAESTDKLAVLAQQLLPFFEAIYALVYADMKISEKFRDELLTILEGICYAVEIDNTKLVKYMWIGLNNTYKQYPDAITYINGIRSLLETYSIIE